MMKHWELRYSGDIDMPALWMVATSRHGLQLASAVALLHVDTLPRDVLPTEDRPVVRIKITEDTDSDA